MFVVELGIPGAAGRRCWRLLIVSFGLLVCAYRVRRMTWLPTGLVASRGRVQPTARGRSV